MSRWRVLLLDDVERRVLVEADDQVIGARPEPRTDQAASRSQSSLLCSRPCGPRERMPGESGGAPASCSRTLARVGAGRKRPTTLRRAIAESVAPDAAPALSGRSPGAHLAPRAAGKVRRAAGARARGSSFAAGRCACRSSLAAQARPWGDLRHDAREVRAAGDPRSAAAVQRPSAIGEATSEQQQALDQRAVLGQPVGVSEWRGPELLPLAPLGSGQRPGRCRRSRSAWSSPEQWGRHAPARGR